MHKNVSAAAPDPVGGSFERFAQPLVEAKHGTGNKEQKTQLWLG